MALSDKPDIQAVKPVVHPRYFCINVACGDDDLVSQGPCSLYCGEHGVEISDLARDKKQYDRLKACRCGHELCRKRTADEGMEAIVRSRIDAPNDTSRPTIRQ